MSKFIEITDLDNRVMSVNVDYIFQVEQGTQRNAVPGTTIKIAANGHHDAAFQYVETRLTYETVMALVKF